MSPLDEDHVTSTALFFAHRLLLGKSEFSDMPNGSGQAIPEELEAGVVAALRMMCAKEPITNIDALIPVRLQ